VGDDRDVMRRRECGVTIGTVWVTIGMLSDGGNSDGPTAGGCAVAGLSVSDGAVA